jgi:hypothetical protein
MFCQLQPRSQQPTTAVLTSRQELTKVVGMGGLSWSWLKELKEGGWLGVLGISWQKVESCVGLTVEVLAGVEGRKLALEIMDGIDRKWAVVKI